MGLVAPSKDHSVFLKRTRHRLRIGQEWCIGREFFFFRTAAGHKQNIENYISTCFTKMTSSISLLCITTSSHHSTTDTLV